MGYFQNVNLIFLVVGNIKNSADRLFHALKIDYRKMNLFTLKRLLTVLGRSSNVSIVKSEKEDYQDWGGYLSLFYRDFKEKWAGLIKINHIFSCEDSKNWVDNQLMVDVCQSDLPKHKVKQLPMIKTGFYGRKSFPGTAKGLHDAIAARCNCCTERYYEDSICTVVANNHITWY
jgi:hypothetical protein